MTDKTLVIKSKLQNISNELGGGETDMSYLAAKLAPPYGDGRTHDVLIQSLDRISRLREYLKRQEDCLRAELMGL
ncbi:hypothetical protein [Acidaminococcus provencensis]|uniref:hypothetical protein n=1 Tax=Acidaminococcus provencensis TaxID=2058289 RepID=UPI0022E8512E|nr:hypothetical protein [Acidaminococcus provencensis]